MEHDFTKDAVLVAIRILPDDVIDVEILVKKPFWAKPKNTSALIFPEIKVKVIVYWKKKKLPYNSEMRELVNQAIGEAIFRSMSGPDPIIVGLDKDGNQRPPLNWPQKPTWTEEA